MSNEEEPCSLKKSLESADKAVELYLSSLADVLRSLDLTRQTLRARTVLRTIDIVRNNYVGLEELAILVNREEQDGDAKQSSD